MFALHSDDAQCTIAYPMFNEIRRLSGLVDQEATYTCRLDTTEVTHRHYVLV